MEQRKKITYQFTIILLCHILFKYKWQMQFKWNCGKHKSTSNTPGKLKGSPFHWLAISFVVSCLPCETEFNERPIQLGWASVLITISLGRWKLCKSSNRGFSSLYFLVRLPSLLCSRRLQNQAKPPFVVINFLCSATACPVANESRKLDDDARLFDETPRRRPGRPPASSKIQPMTPLSPTSPRKQQQLPPGMPWTIEPNS